MSHFNRRQVRELLAFTWQKQFKLSLLMFSLMLMFGPIRYLFMKFYSFTTANNYFDIPDNLALNLISFLLIAILMAVILAFSNLDYLKNIREARFVYSLPVKKETYFLLTVFAGYLNIVLVYLAAYFVSSVLALVELQTLSLTPVLVSLITILIIYIVVVFALVNTRTTLDALIQIALIVFLPLVAFFAFVLLLDQTILGFSAENYFKYVWILSPLMPLFYSGLVLTTWPDPVDFLSKSDFPYTLSSYYTIWLLLTLGFLLVAWYLYRQKRVEDLTAPTYQSIVTTLYLILFAIAFQIFLNLVISPYFIWRIDVIILMIIALIITTLLYVLARAIIDKSFNNFMTNFLLYLVVGSITLVLTFSFSLTQGFGTVKFNLTTKQVKQITVQVETDNYSLSPLVEFTNLEASTTEIFRPYAPWIILRSTDPALIEAIIEQNIIWEKQYAEFHYSKAYLDYTKQPSQYNSFPDYSFGVSTTAVKIVYELNNGLSQTRSYTLPNNWLAPLLPLLINSTQLASKFENFKTKQQLSLTVDALSYSGSTRTYKLTNNEQQTLFKALTLDYQNFDLTSLTYQPLAILNFDNGIYTLLTSEMAHTLAFFKERGVFLPEQFFNFNSDEFYLLLPEADLGLFHHFTFTQQLYSLAYSSDFDLNEITVQYYKLTPEEVKEISSDLLPYGQSEQAFAILIGNAYEMAIVRPAKLDQILAKLTTKRLQEKSLAEFIDNIIYSYK